jgi:hypothetical protein
MKRWKVGISRGQASVFSEIFIFGNWLLFLSAPTVDSPDVTLPLRKRLNT